MCTIDTIIKTSLHPTEPTQTVKRGKSFEQIEYMTNIIFAVAKRLQQPLDKTLDLIMQKGMISVLDGAYKNRKNRTVRSIVDELSNNLLKR